MARERVFRFKQFQVSHSRAAMKVGTDAVLLGAWCSVIGARNVLDVGTGCGVIALMIAQRSAVSHIIGIDIDGNAVEEAQQNFSNSPWRDRLKAELCDFNDYFTKESGTEKFDLIVSNPPYFMNGDLPNGPERTNARHTTELNYSQLFNCSRALLSPEGRVAIVTPADCEQHINECAAFAGMHLTRLLKVAPVKGSEVKRLLWEFSLKPTDVEEQLIAIEIAPLCYTDEYKALCRDFYLKF